MRKRIGWTREQLLIALRLYMRSPRAIWDEFVADPEKIAAEAEECSARIRPQISDTDEVAIQTPAGETEVARMVRARRVQSFFRAAVLTSYEERCAITGLAVPELLVASHIIPWSQSTARRADPTNGLCLNALFDRAFDRGLITIDDSLRVIVARQLRAAIESADLDCSIRDAHGRRIRLQSDWRRTRRPWRIIEITYLSTETPARVGAIATPSVMTRPKRGLHGS